MLLLNVVPIICICSDRPGSHRAEHPQRRLPVGPLLRGQPGPGPRRVCSFSVSVSVSICIVFEFASDRGLLRARPRSAHRCRGREASARCWTQYWGEPPLAVVVVVVVVGVVVVVEVVGVVVAVYSLLVRRTHPGPSQGFEIDNSKHNIT